MTLSNGRNHAILWMVCISATVFLGCGNKSEVATDSRERAVTQDARSTIRSTSELRRLLSPGMGTNEIVANLGQPSWMESLAGGKVVWHHSLPAFPADDEMRGNHVIGVVIGITNGHLANWSCAYISIPSSRKEEVVPFDKVQLGVKDSPILKLFVVSSDPVTGGRFVDTERFPKLGFIPPTPSLTIHKLREVTLEERTNSGPDHQKQTVWAFGIFLTQEDATRLRSLTAANVSKKFLVTVGDETVSAPTIMEPLETGSFVIECNERPLMEAVKKQLARMERQSQ